MTTTGDGSGTTTAPLARLLPAQPDADALLEGMLEYAMERGLDLYPAQEEAILELFADRSVILATPTGSGKSLVATALSYKALAENKRLFYTAPIKALVSEKFFAACRDFGPANVGMMTGDASVNRDAPIICCTAEILANIALREMDDAAVDYVVMDEFHYYGDRDRGWAWQVPLLVVPRARFLLMSATLGDVSRFEQAIETLTGEPPALVTSVERPVPLDFSYRETPIHETVQELYDEGKAPLYIVHFTQRSAAEAAQALMSIDFLEKQQKHAISEALADFRFDSPFGKDLRRWVRHGVGVHHAGMLPKYRLMVERLAQDGLLKIICGTDTLGVGVNIPIRTVLFTKLCKYDGKRTAILTVRDFKQIAGRAGRKGFDDEGFVVAQAPEHVIENLRMRQKASGDPKKLRKISAKKPPDRGYAHWDEQTFRRLVESEPERLESSFEVTHGMLLNVLDRPEGDGCSRMKRLLRASHDPPRLRFHHGRMAIKMFRSLLDAHVIEITKKDGRAFVDVHADLQEDFSLHHALSLYVLETVSSLDRESETYAFDVITLVEATLEDPNAVLMAQLDKKKGDLIAALKADGVEYDDRMKKLDEVDIDKPNLELLLRTFEDFKAKHPWIGSETIRPKTVAREMLEKSLGFLEYVREYGLSRSEGLVLRYLSDAYKALVQSVPETAKTDALYDLTDELGAIVRDVDSSLLDEWDRLRDPAKVMEAVERGGEDLGPPDVTADRRGFVAMIRSLCHRLIRALSLGRFEDALELVVSPEGGPEWKSETLEQAMAAYRAEHVSLRFDQAAKSPQFTLLEEGEDVWQVRQVMVDPEDDNDWCVHARVDLARARREGRPGLELVGIVPS
jgi:superfamily II RNA helicase